LSRALLVYGKSSYQGYPYRHPFVTLHEVIHDGDAARLAEGQLMTPQMLIDLMAGLGRSVPAEILPARVLVRTAEMIVWWSPACERTMFFTDRGNDRVLKSMNGKLYPHPALLFKACGTHLASLCGLT
jgi:PRTRC genetic system protein B